MALPTPSLPSMATAWRATRRTATFPCVSLPGTPGGVPTEVTLVSRLGPGAGTQLFVEAQACQREHGHFVDALDEPSARLGGTDLARGDATALYTFGVGPQGHPFHRHAGHRVFTAVSGSAGARLRFSTATSAELAQDPSCFVRRLHQVDIPPDCLFTVRFGGGTWHQFVPRRANAGHPAFFALSTHTNELGGELDDTLRQRVMRGDGDIPTLTELLPPAVAESLSRHAGEQDRAPVTVLAFDARPGGWAEAACAPLRSLLGHLRGALAHVRARPGFISEWRGARVRVHSAAPADSLLCEALADAPVHHEDHITLRMVPDGAGRPAEAWLADVLHAFLAHRHPGVTRLMALRNRLVKPWGLRTSPLACPVSSLLGPAQGLHFAERFPVHALRVSPAGDDAQVLLGADDRHLRFRTCVAVRQLPDASLEFSLGTRVSCRNAFGRLYLGLIDAAHRRYIAPRLLATAVDALQAPAPLPDGPAKAASPTAFTA